MLNLLQARDGKGKTLRVPAHQPRCGLPPLPRRRVRQTGIKLLGKILDGARNCSDGCDWTKYRQRTSDAIGCLSCSHYVDRAQYAWRCAPLTFWLRARFSCGAAPNLRKTCLPSPCWAQTHLVQAKALANGSSFQYGWNFWRIPSRCRHHAVDKLTHLLKMPHRSLQRVHAQTILPCKDWTWFSIVGNQRRNLEGDRPTRREERFLLMSGHVRKGPPHFPLILKHHSC